MQATVQSAEIWWLRSQSSLLHNLAQVYRHEFILCNFKVMSLCFMLQHYTLLKS